MRKAIVAIAALMALFVIACGSTSPTIKEGGTSSTAGGAKNVPAGPKKFALGEDAVLTLANGSTATIQVKSVAFQGGNIVASVSVQATSGAIDYNRFDWSATAGDGTSLDISIGNGVKNVFASGTLAAGQKYTGNLVYAGTAAQVKGSNWTYTNGLTTLAYWVAP